jgi:hypothetical protein
MSDSIQASVPKGGYTPDFYKKWNPDDNSLGNLALGAGNGLLFGLPEAVTKAIGGDKVRQIVDAYKASHPAYGVGDTIGTVGSSLVPGGVIAKGLGAGAKALGAEKVGAGLMKLGEAASGPASLTQGLASAAEQTIPRAAATQLDTGDIGETAKQTALGLGIGGAVGGGLKLLGKGAEALANTSVGRNLKDEADKFVQDSVLDSADVTSSTIRKAAMNSARRLGLDKTTASFNNADGLKDKISDLIIKNNLFGRVEREQFLDEVGPQFQQVASKYNSNPLDFTDLNLAIKITQDPAVAEYMTRNAIGPKKVEDQVLSMMDDLSKRPDWNQAKAYLVDKQKLGARSGTEEGDAQREIASAFEDAIVQHTASVAPEYTELAAQYPAIKALKMASGTEKADISSPLRQGSSTAQKLLLASAGGALGSSVSDDNNKMLGGIAGAISAPFAERLLARGVPQLLGPAMAKLPGIAQKVGSVVGPSALGAAERGGLIYDSANQIPPESDGQIRTMPLAPNPQFTFPYANGASNGQLQASPQGANPFAKPDRIQDGIDALWKTHDPTGSIEAASPGAKEEYSDEIKKNITNPDGSLNYFRMGNILFPNQPESAKAFKEGFATIAKMDQSLDKASNWVNLNQQDEADKQAMIGTLTDEVKRATGNEKSARDAVTAIILNPLFNPQQKKAKLFKLLSDMNPEIYGKNGILAQGGAL